MRLDQTKVILLALLLATAYPVVSQTNDLDDSDLESLLEDSKTLPSDSPSAPAAENTPAPTQNSAPSPGVAESPDALSSETVDLEAIPDSPSDAAATSEAPATSETPATTETPASDDLPPLPSTPADNTAETPKAPDDDLEALKGDLGDEGEFVPAPNNTDATAEKPAESPETKSKDKTKTAKQTGPDVFDVGSEERVLLNLARNIQGQIPDTEWNEVATAAKVDSYTVVKNDWLFKISKRFFGTGFYYPKIWSLNSFITNPHFIEPGMVLSFTTGSTSRAPEVKLGAFTEDELNAQPGTAFNENPTDLQNFGEETIPPWVKEKAALEKQGIYFQYASEETLEDLNKRGEQSLNREYENYEPPKEDVDVVVPRNYDQTGFDRNSRIFYSFKEGFYLSTFLSTNIVQDFGSITNGPDENIFFTTLDTAYVKFDSSINAVAGDRFSVYSSGGLVSQKNSDRKGYKYSIVGQIKLVRKIEDKWEVQFTQVSGTPQRGDRITAYTPKIERITRTYNSRLVEAAVMAGFEPRKDIMGMGDVIYLDRGRADGVEMGNVFEVFGFKDRQLNKNITQQPTYKLAELTVITLTDNFATALVTTSKRDFYPGDIAITKTKEAYLREQRASELKNKASDTLGGKALEELDVELNLDNLNEDLLKEADKIQLTEDELAELERQEREKSVIKDSERDLKQLERLENEIDSAEKILNDAKLDEDKLLEGEDLNKVEKKQQGAEKDNLEEIEENLGKRYIDEDLNSKDNPYGLTEFDVEEVDELLNLEKKNQN